MKNLFRVLDNKYKEITLSNLNVIFGHSNSGKTTLCHQFEEGYLGKLKEQFKINGLPVEKNQWQVILIDPEMNMEDQIKMTSKTILNNIFSSSINEHLIFNSNEFLNDIIKTFQPFETTLKKISSKINESSFLKGFDMKFQIDEERILEIIKNSLIINIRDEFEISDSHSKDLFYSLLFNSLEQVKKDTIVIIDNYDLFLDEETTIFVLKQIKRLSQNPNLFFFLTTNKPLSLGYLYQSATIFCIKNYSLYDLSHLDKILLMSMGGEFNNLERFYEILGQYYTLEEAQIYLNKLTPFLSYNLGRMLTSQNYLIQPIKTHRENIDDIIIYPTSEVEYQFLMFIDHYWHITQ